MQKRKLGKSNLEVSAIGLGCMSIGIAEAYTSALRDENDGVRLLQRALDLGITLLDTADIYGTSEILVGKAIAGRRNQVVLATKFGFDKPSTQSKHLSPRDGRHRARLARRDHRIADQAPRLVIVPRL